MSVHLLSLVTIVTVLAAGASAGALIYQRHTRTVRDFDRLFTEYARGDSEASDGAGDFGTAHDSPKQSRLGFGRSEDGGAPGT